MFNAGDVVGWTDAQAGIGPVLTGITAQGDNVKLRQCPDGWHVNFYWVVIAHSVVVASKEG
jgi:hypothetical protein